MIAATIITLADGTTELLHGPDVPPSEQRADVQNMRNRGLPKGVVRAEIWERKCVKLAVPPVGERPALKPATKSKAPQKPAKTAALKPGSPEDELG